jgi:hypothetical protein
VRCRKKWQSDYVKQDPSVSISDRFYWNEGSSQSSSTKKFKTFFRDKNCFSFIDMSFASVGLLTIIAALSRCESAKKTNDYLCVIFFNCLFCSLFVSSDSDDQSEQAAEKKQQSTTEETRSDLPVVIAELTAPPNVPKPITRNYPVHLIVDMSVVIQVRLSLSFDLFSSLFSSLLIPSTFDRKCQLMVSMIMSFGHTTEVYRAPLSVHALGM